MKCIKNIIAGFLLFSTAGFAYSQELVAMDESPKADFENYETYSWTKTVLNAGAEDFLNDIVLKTTIEDAIEYELEARGYEQKNTTGDLLVNFQVFEEPTEFRGYEETNLNGEEFIEEDAATTYQLEAGTLLIQFMDKEEGSVVWQGYASGIMDGEVFDKDPERIKEAVHQIFEQYSYSAK